MNRWILVFFSILLFGSAWLWWTRPANLPVAASSAPGAGVGRLAPDFSLQTVDGKTFQLSELRGTPVVLNFWATWCGPCQRELPALQRAAEHYGADVAVVAVDQGETVETVQRYMDAMGLSFTVPLDGTGDVGVLYNVKGLPTTFFIDAQGVIQSLWMGEMNSVTLAENIEGIR